MILLVPVKYGAQAIEFFTVEIPRYGSSRILDDVGAGVGDRFAKLYPLPRGIEHRPQDLVRPVGRAGLLGAGGIELGGHSGMIDGIEPESCWRIRTPAARLRLREAFKALGQPRPD